VFILNEREREMAELVFKTTLKEVPISIDGKSFVLRELDGRQKGKYLNKMGGRIVLNNKGEVSSFKDYAGLESILLEQCLYDEDEKLVPASMMEGWPSTMLTMLFDQAQILSGLNEEARKKQEAEAKNS
jgi:hypothetical protein